MFIALAGLLCLFGCWRAQLETRYYALSFCMLATGGFEMAGWPHGERILFTFTILLHNYLVDGDEYLLIFFQIHALAMWYIVSHFPWTFAPHTCIMAFFIFRQLHGKLDRLPELLQHGGALENMSVTAALMASSWHQASSEHPSHTSESPLLDLSQMCDVADNRIIIRFGPQSL